MITIKMKKEESKEKGKGYRVLKIKGARKRGLPKEYLSYDPAVPAVVAYNSPNIPRGLHCLGGVDRRIWGQCPGYIYEGGWYTVEQNKYFMRYLRAAIRRLKEINRRIKAPARSGEEEVLFINGREG